MPDVEEQIRRAIQDGKFTDLPGTGKPLSIEENPYTSQEWRLAYHVLHSSGYSIPWIEQRREIEQQIEQLLHTLHRVVIWCNSENASKLSEAYKQAECQRALEAFVEGSQEINKRILDFNLQAPAPEFHLPIIQPQREIERLTSTPLSDTL